MSGCDINLLQMNRHLFFEFFAYRNQKELQKVTLNDPNVRSKLDFTKPINFLIHGWFGLVNDDGSIPFQKDGMCGV